jgi:hypothetical protein
MSSVAVSKAPPPLFEPLVPLLPLPPLPEFIGGAAVTVTCADPDWFGSAADTAPTVTVAGDGTVAGAVYVPVPEIVPIVLLPPLTPFTFQVTAVLAVFFTVAENT